MTDGTGSRHAYSAGMAVARTGYRAFNSMRARLFGRRARQGDKPVVYYGGALGGDIGGPLVKVRRLQKMFPQTHGPFNLLYSLSGAPFLSQAALMHLKARGIVIVHNQNGVFHPGWYGGDWAAENARMAHAYRQADHIFWQSEFCRASADRYLGTHHGTGEVLFNAVDISHFTPPPRRCKEVASPFKFLLTGRLRAFHHYILEDCVAGLATVRAAGLDANLVIAGTLDAGARGALDTAIRLHDLLSRVHFIGPYSQADAPAIYGAADAYITTIHAAPCPNAVIEAMACGLPIVFATTGGIPELVGPDAGCGIPAVDNWAHPFRPDPDAVGSAMLKVFVNRVKMARAARVRAEREFNLNTWLNKHNAVFSRLLAEVAGDKVSDCRSR